MTKDAIQKAIIYCRVSDAKQKTRGDGLGSQETTCRLYAERMGYDVLQVFRDDITGKTADREGLKNLLIFLQGCKGTTVVIVDDANRLARSMRTHYAIRDAVTKAGGRLESPKRVYTADPDEDFMEQIEAAFAAEFRRKNAVQTKDRMRARVLNGFWNWCPPTGYKSVDHSGGGHILAVNEPLASIVREALEGYASGRFATQAEVKRFLEASPPFPTDKNGYVTNQRVKNLLTQPLYAGYLRQIRWDIPLRKGQHEALISFETYSHIQDRLAGNARLPSRKDINEDFPLRGFVACGDCDHAMTATWSKGKGGRYPYYMCRQHGCVSNGKSIARDKVEGALEALVRSLVPAREVVELATAMFRDLWDSRAKNAKERRTALKLETAALEKKIGQLLDRIVGADSPAVISAYERKISELESDKLVLAENIAKCGTPVGKYDETFQTSMRFLANPWILWESGTLEDRRAMLKLVFGGHLAYGRETGFQTPEISLPFKALEEISGQEREMARRRWR